MGLARKLLYPFSLLYSGATRVRNLLYDNGSFNSRTYELPVICVGNLSVGGTGKSPMVEYLISLLQPSLKIATLSRGYKRTTKGFHLLTGSEEASAVGDEPLQFKSKFPDVLVAVDEVRTHGIEELLKLETPPEVIVLDDAFQHRKVAAGLNILLTPYQNLYVDDLVLPAGNLREPRSGAKRAQIVVVTKCPPELEPEERRRVEKKLDLQEGQHLFFSKIVYDEKVIGERPTIPLESLRERNFTLVTGIANPKPLSDFLKSQKLEFEHLSFPDHHNFTGSELELIRKQPLVLTTEKDYMRLQGAGLKDKLFFLPIRTTFLSLGEKEEFDRLVKRYAIKK